MHILVVEDERLVAQDLQQTLRQLGHTVPLTVASGEAALAAVAASRPDLVLMDIHLRGTMDGVQTAQLLRDRFDVPVIYLTAHADPATIERARHTAPFGYVLKPFDEQNLVITIELAVYKHQMEQRLQQTNGQLAALVRKLEERTREVLVLSELGDMLLSCANAEETYVAIITAARRLLPDASGALSIRRETRELVPVITWGPTAHEIGEQLARSCHTCTSLGNSQSAGAISCPCANQSLPLTCVPLVDHEEMIGSLQLHLSPPSPAIDTGNDQDGAAAQQRLVMALGRQAALGLVSVRMREALQDQAIRDPLTGLFNRRYMEATLERELWRATRSHYPIGLIMLDIDHFKRVNDTVGHIVGDAVLRAVAQVLQSAVRAEDIVCRYGGEEFILILPSASLEVAYARAEAILRAIAEMHISPQSRGLPPVTASAGVAVIPDQNMDMYQALHEADVALYHAKQHGRNRVEVAGERFLCDNGSHPPD